jgi:hypothetical protein
MKRGKSYNLHVNKCKVLKTFYLCKVSFRINLVECKKNIFNFNFTCTLSMTVIVIISLYYLRNIWNCWTGYTIYPGLGQFTLFINHEKRKLTQTRLPGYTTITCSTISNIPYNLIFTTKFNDSLILITIILCDYLNLSLADEHVGDVTIPTQVIVYNQNFLQAD